MNITVLIGGVDVEAQTIDVEIPTVVTGHSVDGLAIIEPGPPTFVVHTPHGDIVRNDRPTRHADGDDVTYAWDEDTDQKAG